MTDKRETLEQRIAREMRESKPDVDTHKSREFLRGLRDVQAIKDSAKRAFKGGLFSKPEWLEDTSDGSN